MPARYVFHVRFRLTPERDVTLNPQTFETTMYRDADHPSEGDGWLFFRDHLWRGDLTDNTHFRALTEEALAVHVEDVEYRRFEVDEAHYEALKETIGANLELFNATSVPEVLNKYLGSSVEVERHAKPTEDGETGSG